jgi:WXXGXW repeat (2 copies)
MLRFKSLRLASLVGALLLFGTSACTVHAQGRVRTRGAVVVEDPGPAVVVVEDPPPPRYERVDSRPGYIFIQGRWDRRGNNWAWVDGHWERERANAYYQPGRWQRHHDRGNRGHVWVEGRWVVRGGGRR